MNKVFEQIVAAIVDYFHPRRVVLFGSHARGEARPDSDADLFVEMEARVPRRESNYASLLAKSEHDLLNIQNNLSEVQIPWDTLCFHAQQAAEKCLKGFLI